jgi:hypothetical protein
MSNQDKDKKKIVISKSPEIKKEISKEEILNRLFKETDAPIEKVKSDDYLDSINDIRRLLSLEEIDIQDRYIAKHRNVYRVRFKKAYYVHLYRFIGITVTKENEKKLMKDKPFVFALRTLLIIYNRFPKGTIDLLRRKNIKINGVYVFKHHEFFTEVGLLELEQYLNEAIRLMDESKYWSQFLRKLSRLNNKPYQIDAFDND